MAGLMAKMLVKQGKTALGLKDEGNQSFKLGTKDGYHRAASKYAIASRAHLLARLRRPPRLLACDSATNVAASGSERSNNRMLRADAMAGTSRRSRCSRRTP
jgi:hypothetical protein